MAFNTREQRLTLLVFLLVGAWASLTWLVDPLLARAADLDQQVEAQAAKLEKMSVLMASRAAVEQEYIQAEPYLRAAIAQDAPGAFLGELEALARQADVQINLKPRAPRSREDHRLGVELELLASQERLFALLDALLTMPQLIEIERLHLAPAPGREGRMRAHLILGRWTPSP